MKRLWSFLRFTFFAAFLVSVAVVKAAERSTINV